MPSTALTRRRALATAGTGAVLALAGCSAPEVETRRTESFDVSLDGSDSLAVRNRHGSVDVDVPAIRDDTAIRASNGGVEVRGVDLTDPTVSRTRVAGTVGGGGPSLTLLAENGVVEVRALEP